MELLERSEAVAALDDVLRSAERGAGRVALIAGEAGVGKTVLVEQFAADHAGAARTVVVACDGMFTPRPLGPLIDIASRFGGRLADALEANAGRPALFAILLDELRSGRTATVLVIEDLHWADEATLDLFRYLARRIGTTRTLVIATYRDDELEPTHPLRLTLGDVVTFAGVRRLRLERLAQPSVEALAVDAGIDPGKLYAQTGGNPFFVTEVLASASGEIPDTVRDAVLARVARLSSDGRAALDAASVLGSDVDIGVLEEVLGQAPSGIDECVAHGVLRASDRVLSFRHEIARAAIEAALLPRNRIELHRRALEALRARARDDDDLPRLAHHAEMAGDVAATVEYAGAAAEHAAKLQAHRESAAQYDRLLRFGSALPPSTRLQTLETCSYEHFMSGRLDAALATRRNALTLCRELGHQRQEGDDRRWESRILWFLGRSSEAWESAHAAVAILERFEPGTQLAWAYSNLSQLCMLRWDVKATLEWGGRAIEIAERLGEQEVLLHALNNVGTAEGYLGSQEGLEKIEMSIRLAREADMDEHVERGLGNLANDLILMRDYERGMAVLEEGIAFRRDRDVGPYRDALVAWRARVLSEQGRWDQAASDASSVLEDPLAPVMGRIEALCVRAQIRTRRGDAEPWTLLDEARSLAEPTGELKNLRHVVVARAEAHLLAGEDERARTEVRVCLDLALQSGFPWVVGEIAYWLWKAGGLDEIPAMSAEPFALQMMNRWEEAASAWERIGCPYETALALSESSDEQALRAALRLFESLGALPMAGRVQRMLREGGARGIPRAPGPQPKRIRPA
jgi:tetratricopeptide (TPR) repeat protein